MAEQTEIALATSVNNIPNVRIVNYYFDSNENILYFSSFKGNDKIKEIESAIENALPSVLRKVTDFSNYMDGLFKDCVLFKVEKNICICENKNIRISQSTLSLLNGTKRKVTMLGIVTSNFNDTDWSIFLNEQPNMILSHGANAFIGITTNSFDIVQEGDSYIRPIALYFE